MPTTSCRTCRQLDADRSAATSEFSGPGTKFLVPSRWVEARTVSRYLPYRKAVAPQTHKILNFNYVKT